MTNTLKSYSAYFLLLGVFAFGLSACSSKSERIAPTPPTDITTSQALIRFLNERQIEEASALFEEGATLIKEKFLFRVL